MGNPGLFTFSCLGHRRKAENRVCHLAQFIPPFVYSSVINAVCMLICSILHTSALGILKSELTPHMIEILNKYC